MGEKKIPKATHLISDRAIRTGQRAIKQVYRAFGPGWEWIDGLEKPPAVEWMACAALCARCHGPVPRGSHPRQRSHGRTRVSRSRLFCVLYRGYLSACSRASNAQEHRVELIVGMGLCKWLGVWLEPHDALLPKRDLGREAQPEWAG